MTTVAQCDAVRADVFQVTFEYDFGKNYKIVTAEWDGENPLEIPFYGEEVGIKIVAIKKFNED